MTETRTLLTELASELEQAALAGVRQCTGAYWDAETNAFCALGAIARGRGWDPVTGTGNYQHEIVSRFKEDELTVNVPGITLKRVIKDVAQKTINAWLPPGSRIKTSNLLILLNDDEKLSFGQIARVLRALAEEI